MGFGNGAFQAARIAIDGFTIIENIQTGKIQASLSSTKFKSVNSNPSNGVSWGWADYIVNNSKVTNMASSLEWTGSSDAVSAAVAVNLGTNTTTVIDGFASVNGTDTDTLALTLSTVNTNDLILLSVTEDVRANTTTSITDTAGLTWKKLFVQGSSGANVGIGIYYAIATTALSNDTITVTYTASTSPASAQAMAFGVTNVDTSQPFDPNSTPTGSSLINATILLSGPITTSQSNTVVIDFFAGNNSSTGFTVETQVFSVSNTDGTLTINPSSGNVIASLNLANANTWTNTQTINPTTSVSSLILLGEQTTADTSMLKIIYDATDANGLVAGTYPCIQITAGTDTYIGVQAGNNNIGTAAQFNSNTGIGYQVFYKNTSGYNSVAIGYQALYNNTTGYNNVGIGDQSLYNNTTGSNNIGVGAGTLQSNTTGINNVVVGYNALTYNTTANNNSAIGYGALNANTTGNSNCAFGSTALLKNTTGYGNSAFGYQALQFLTTGYSNVAIGSSAGNTLTTGDYNVVIGSGALYSDTSGSYNIAIGVSALYANSTATNNIGIGANALLHNTDGNSNISIGTDAQLTNTGGSDNVTIGYQAGYSFTTASGNVFIGYQAGYSETGSNLLYISNSNTSTPLIYGNFSSATLKINGTLTPNGIRENIAAKTAAYTLTATDSYITASASSAAFTITLPSATGSGQKYVVIKTDSTTNAVTLAAAGTDTIEGSASKALSAQYDKIAVVDIASGLWADLGTGGGI